jgi:hypothetical protein
VPSRVLLLQLVTDEASGVFGQFWVPVWFCLFLIWFSVQFWGINHQFWWLNNFSSQHGEVISAIQPHLHWFGFGFGKKWDSHFVVILGFLCDMAKSAIDLQVLVARGLQLEKAARATSFLYIEVKLYLF